MPPTIIPPTVGRVVLFRPSYSSALSANRGDQPMDAHVCYVWNDRLINVAGFDHDGMHFRKTLVRLIQEGDEPARHGEDVCTWMDYQLGQAKKYEALAEKQDALAKAQAEATPNDQLSA